MNFSCVLPDDDDDDELNINYITELYYDLKGRNSSQKSKGVKCEI